MTDEVDYTQMTPDQMYAHLGDDPGRWARMGVQYAAHDGWPSVSETFLRMFVERVIEVSYATREARREAYENTTAVEAARCPSEPGPRAYFRAPGQMEGILRGPGKVLDVLRRFVRPERDEDGRA